MRLRLPTLSSPQRGPDIPLRGSAWQDRLQWGPHQSQSFLTSAQSMQWVVEVSYPNDLDIRFEWDRTDVPQDINLWIVDSQGRIDMKSPPPDIPPFPLSILSGDDARAFLICGQTPGAGICPNTWP